MEHRGLPVTYDLVLASLAFSEASLPKEYKLEAIYETVNALHRETITALAQTGDIAVHGLNRVRSFFGRPLKVPEIPMQEVSNSLSPLTAKGLVRLNHRDGPDSTYSLTSVGYASTRASS
jgi:hypothetical protein